MTPALTALALVTWLIASAATAGWRLGLLIELRLSEDHDSGRAWARTMVRRALRDLDGAEELGAHVMACPSQYGRWLVRYGDGPYLVVRTRCAVQAGLAEHWRQAAGERR